MTTAGQLPLLSGVTSQDAVASIKEELCGVTVSYEVVRQHLVVRLGLAAKMLAHGTHCIALQCRTLLVFRRRPGKESNDVGHHGSHQPDAQETGIEKRHLGWYKHGW